MSKKNKCLHNIKGYCCLGKCRYFSQPCNKNCTNRTQYNYYHYYKYNNNFTVNFFEN